jgi:hypothetical protein
MAMSSGRPSARAQVEGVKLPNGFAITPEIGGVRFETPSTFGWAKTTRIALEEIKREIQTGEPAWRSCFCKSKRGLKRKELRHAAQ